MLADSKIEATQVLFALLGSSCFFLPEPGQNTAAVRRSRWPECWCRIALQARSIWPGWFMPREHFSGLIRVHEDAEKVSHPDASEKLSTEIQSM